MNSFTRLISNIKGYRSYAFLNIIFNILTVIFSVISLLMLKPFLDILFQLDDPVTVLPERSFDLNYVADHFNYFLTNYIEANGRLQGLKFVCIIIVVVFFLKNLFRYLAMASMAPVRNGIVRDVRSKLFRKLMRLPLGYFTEERKGDLISRMTADVQEIQWSILSALEVIVRDPLAIILSLVVMLMISPNLTVFTLILILFTGVIIGRIGKTLKRKSAKAQSKLGSLISILDEALSGLRIIKSFNARGYQEAKFAKENEGYRNIMNKILWRRDLSSPLSEFMGIAVIAVLLWYGGRIVFRGDLEASMFVVFVMMFYNVIGPAKSFSTAFYNIQKGIAASDRVYEVLDADYAVKEIENPKNLPSFEKEIEYQNVHFSYQSEQAILNGINLKIPKGKIVALVGPSGAGKTTLVDLLPRFYDVTKGALLIDGQDVKNCKISDLRALTGVVSQEAILFNDTIYNNIVFGMENISKEQVIEAAKVANAHDFILESEQGYETTIGDRGTKLSGGQRQRLTIARAVLKNPPILILDEATSSLDSKSEKLVQDALFKLMKERTSIVIAHRLSTIQFADEIIVLDAGTIIERGKHKELIEKGGTYRKLVELQAF